MRPRTFVLLGAAFALGPYAIPFYLRAGPWLWFTSGLACLGYALVLTVTDRNAPSLASAE
ncbi:hypothetical protein [Haladaptatus sp. NG-SE-30]